MYHHTNNSDSPNISTYYMEEDTLLNDAFDLLSKANELEEQYDREGKKEDSLLIQASSTYFEAVFLFKRYLNRLPFEPSSPRSSEASRTRKLLKEKIRHYEGVAADLLGHLGSGCDDQSPHRKSLHVHVDTPTHCSNLSASAAPFQSDDIAEKVSLANNIFATALDHDEKSRYDDASESYQKACESYLEAIKISEESSKEVDAVKIRSIKRKLERIMDRIEELKAGQPNKVQYSRSITKSFTHERE